MSEKDFLLKVRLELEKRLGEDAHVKLQKVRKNNNVMYNGFIIQRKDSNISPTIYMDSFYEMYERGERIERIVERILQVYQNGTAKKPIDMSFFMNFAEVKDRIVYRIINVKRNKELLEEVPHILYLDLAICFYYAFYNEELGEGMIMIQNSHMDMWRTTHQELMKLATENTPKLFPPVFITLDTIIQNMHETKEEEWLAASGFYILTNRQKCQGAASVLYPEILEHIAEKLDGNFYVIPSSIHEVILFKDQGREDWRYLQEMIAEANSTQLLEEDILSDYPYYYNQKDKKLSQIKVV